ncbi:GRIP and coiled-coil domain-containing protein 2 [Fragariocoptes setiger]|uniref:GRIP and coiled-coil domain-containing protein 2 n=1 Tax=Fragariocoptes setiger TaxID=1670756 RepID=A0ABQ7S9A3_9ACAR|nr:GRIP and coiled-coil domain-containing protein 2 [Fragariocoptes setiger]
MDTEGEECERLNVAESSRLPSAQPNVTAAAKDEDKLSIYKALALKLKKELAKSKEALESCQNECRELNQKLESSLKENTKLAGRFSQQVKNYNSLQAEYDKVLDESEALKKKLKAASMNRPDDEIKELKSQLQQKDTKIFELESKLSDTLLQVEQKNQLKNKLRDISESYRELEAKHKDVVAERDRLNAEVARHQENVETLQVRCRELSSQIKKLDSTLFCERHNFEIVKSSFETKVKNLKEQLAAFEEETQCLQRKFDEYRSKAGQIIQQSNQGQTNSIRTFEAEKMRQLESINRQLEGLIAQLEKKLESTEKARDGLEKKVASLIRGQQANQDRLDRLELLETSCDQLKKENMNLNRALEDLSKKPNTLVEQISAEYECKILDIKKDYEDRIKVMQERLEELNGSMHNDITNTEPNNERNYNSTTESTTNTIHQVPSYLDNNHSAAIATRDDSLSTCSAEDMSTRSNDVKSDHSQSMIPFTDQLSRLWSTNDDTRASATPLSTASNNDVEMERLTQQVRQVQHSNTLLSNQVMSLKDEIRRLHLGNERLEIAEKLEYLKNIIVKFMTLEGKPERQHLIPVLATMLKLTPEEQSHFYVGL